MSQRQRSILSVCHFVILATWLGTPWSILDRAHGFSRPFATGTPRNERCTGTDTVLRSAAAPATISITLIHPENPTILTVDNLLSEEEIVGAMRIIRNRCRSNAVSTTSDYQEDIFRAGAREEEDAHFASAVDRAAAAGASTGASDAEGFKLEDRIPAQHSESPLERFLWVATNHPESMTEEDILRGANFIRRREAREKWESEGGRRLLDLSMDEEPFEKAGRRYEMPEEVRTMFVDRVVGRVLRHAADKEEAAGVMQWTVQDSTVVLYDEGSSQVPHVDPCDATVLVYLDDGERFDRDPASSQSSSSRRLPLVGGDTCFPLIGCRVPVEVGKTLLFFSSAPSTSEGGARTSLASRERDVMSLHHGGRVAAGGKVVAQIMLNAETSPGVDKALDGKSWLDLLSRSLGVKF